MFRVVGVRAGTLHAANYDLDMRRKNATEECEFVLPYGNQTFHQFNSRITIMKKAVVN